MKLKNWPTLPKWMSLPPMMPKKNEDMLSVKIERKTKDDWWKWLMNIPGMNFAITQLLSWWKWVGRPLRQYLIKLCPETCPDHLRNRKGVANTSQLCLSWWHLYHFGLFKIRNHLIVAAMPDLNPFSESVLRAVNVQSEKQSIKKATISRAMAPKNKAYVIPTSNSSKPLLFTLKWKIKIAATTEAKDMNLVAYPNRQWTTCTLVYRAS